MEMLENKIPMAVFHSEATSNAPLQIRSHQGIPIGSTNKLLTKSATKLR
jgi:hypothetical protein